MQSLYYVICQENYLLNRVDRGLEDQYLNPHMQDNTILVTIIKHINIIISFIKITIWTSIHTT